MLFHQKQHIQGHVSRLHDLEADHRISQTAGRLQRAVDSGKPGKGKGEPICDHKEQDRADARKNAEINTAFRGAICAFLVQLLQ